MTAFLSLRPEGEGADVRLLFHHQPTVSARLLSGTVVHAVAALTLVLAAQFIPDKFYDAVLPERLPDELVYLIQPGPSGGGGGGNRSPEPPPPAQLRGPEEITVPVIAPPEPQLQPVDIEPPPAAIPAQAMAGANQNAPGVPFGTGSDPDARGLGNRGAGREKGEGPGIDGGPHRPGNGVLPPRVRLEVKPHYTSDAMRAKIQGLVVVSVVVLPDGSVTDARVVRSLDRTFGLDTKAVEAARQSRFFPGTRQGQPVPVLVNIELEFNLR